MSTCYWCYWGWPKPVADIYNKALAELDGDDSVLHYGPSHVVWDDENWHCAEACLADCDKVELYDRYTKEELEICRTSLQELAALPETDWNIEPEAYYDDDDHPEKYPPPEGVIMIRHNV